MDDKNTTSNKLLSIREEKFIREVNYDTIAGGATCQPPEQFLLDLEILHKRPSSRLPSQRLLVSVKPRPPVFKTLYVVEKSHFHSKKSSDRSGSRLAIGDNSSLSTNFSGNDPNDENLISFSTNLPSTYSQEESYGTSSTKAQAVSSSGESKYSKIDNQSSINVHNNSLKHKSAKRCYICTQPLFTMNLPEVGVSADTDTNKLVNSNIIDISTLVTNTTSEGLIPPSHTNINNRINKLERKILKQEMVFRPIDSNVPMSSSEEESKATIMKSTSVTGRPGCSYIQQYSHVPETSAFQRYAQKASPLTASKATTLDKEHNSEQYGRDFTAYDGITARGRRHSASVPLKRDEIPKMAAERVHKIRHKLNPVRDYRLMDTVHYLAQGEFAPRDDGIKLTPSREAVLSDIIWEDVCRTHWPGTRIGTHRVHPDRYHTRNELQRMIDSLMRERVAHMERRRRRHYRIVKLNHRHESYSKPMGKTGDIIVASHKNRHGDDVPTSDHAANVMKCEKRRQASCSRGCPRSYDRSALHVRSHRYSHDHGYDYEESPAGTSNAGNRSSSRREATCCYQAASPTGTIRNTRPLIHRNNQQPNCEVTSTSSSSKTKCPRLVVKKDRTYRRHHRKDEPDLEHYILLPTLVVRTPSNIRRQKKFNKLYHRILNVRLNDAANCASAVDSEAPPKASTKNSRKKDIGMNINITLSNSSNPISQDEH